MSLKDELKSIISGISPVTNGTTIQTVANHIRKSKAAGTNPEEKELIKEQETSAILNYSRSNNFFFASLNKERYLAQGAKQRVYLDEDGRHVIKLNASIFYRTWEDYLNNLLLHNFFFPATSYELIGFYQEGERLCSVVKQLYIITKETTDENMVKELMALNGFTNKKNSDYFSKILGIIVEDLHDENVLTSNGVLFFIDTVFYLTKDFYEE